MFRAVLGRYADALSETLLLELQPTVAQSIGLKLLPCYSYLRIYGNNAVLPWPEVRITSGIELQWFPGRHPGRKNDIYY